MSDSNFAFIQTLIRKHKLNLAGLTVLTELASGPYLLNPMIAALAGAKSVVALGADSSFGSYESLVQDFYQATGASELGNQIKLTNDLDFSLAQRPDIVTNSGHLRPITREFLLRLKATSVIPLMWETWEFRPNELDLHAAKDLGIAVLGTQETHPLCDMRSYSALTGIKLITEHRFKRFGSRILVVGQQPTLGVPVRQALIGLGLDVHSIAGVDLDDFLVERANVVDYVLLAEHGSDRMFVGPGGFTSVQAVVEAGVRGIGVLSGAVDSVNLRLNGVSLFPPTSSDSGLHMSYSPAVLGPEPVLELFAAGLAVGAAIAYPRLQGQSVEESIRAALATSPAMDFCGSDAWLVNR